MFKRYATSVVLLVVVLGMVFVGLDILDVAENFKINLPAPILDTVFIAAVAVLVAYLAAKKFRVNASSPALWLGTGALSFGVGNLMRWWFVQGLNIQITTFECAALIASVLHLVGAALVTAGKSINKTDSRWKLETVLGGYLGVLASIALVTWLSFWGVIPPFYVPGESATLIRNIIQGITAIFFLAAALACLKGYSRSRTGFLYWYSLGLMLFALGAILISQGAVDSRSYWLGKASQYVGGIYFLAALLGSR